MTPVDKASAKTICVDILGKLEVDIVHCLIVVSNRVRDEEDVQHKDEDGDVDDRAPHQREARRSGVYAWNTREFNNLI